MLEEKFNNLSIVSEDWLIVDNSKCNEGSSSSLAEVPQPKPYVPFTVEELSFTTRLDTWTNCNVRVIGLLQSVDKNNYLESVEELGGPYRVLLDFKKSDILQSDQVIQVFGEIKIIHKNGNTKPYISVSFFRKLKYKEMLKYKKAIEHMKPFIPLFLNVQNSSKNHDDDNSLYYQHHELDDDDDDDTGGKNDNHNNDCCNNIGFQDKNIVYSDDDFNYAYNTDHLF